MSQPVQFQIIQCQKISMSKTVLFQIIQIMHKLAV